MSGNHTGNTQPTIDREEHRSVGGVDAKAVIPYVQQGTNGHPVPLGGGLVPEAYDYFSVASTDSITDVYTFRSGGVSGDVVATLTLVFADSTHQSIASVARA